jgi:hypothetical protein
MISPFEGMTRAATFRCHTHGTTEALKPTVLMNDGQYGCDRCAREAQASSNRLTLSKVKDELAPYLADHVSIIGIMFDVERRTTLIEIRCQKHGLLQTTKGYLRRSPYSCSRCGDEWVGYASYRMRRLLESGIKGKETWIGVMEVAPMGITTIKVGVSTRSLERRYLWDLKKVHFEFQLPELDAYVLENRIHRKFAAHSDRRVLKAGMRQGKRWAGDTECYWPKQLADIVQFLKREILELRNSESDYWATVRDIESRAPIPRVVDRPKSVANAPKAVVGLCPATMNEVKRFKSLMEAQRHGYRNLSLVLSKKRSQRLAGGLHWVDAASFDRGHIPPLRLPNCGIPVRCIETNELFVSAQEAARTLRERGIKVGSPHITSVCRGRRRRAGGFTWRIAEVSRLDASQQKSSDVCVAQPAPARNAAKRVRAYSLASNRLVGEYASLSEASRRLGLSGPGNITTALKRGRPASGYRFKLAR